MDFSKLKLIKKEVKQAKKPKKEKIVTEERNDIIYHSVYRCYGERSSVTVTKIDTGEVVYQNEFPTKYKIREYKFLDHQFGKGKYKEIGKMV